MICLNHILVPAHDKEASARFLADMLGLEVTSYSAGSPVGRFAVVCVGDVTFDFDDVESFDAHHYAFEADDDEFDRILSRVRAAGIEYSADPLHRRPGELNDVNGGRGMYFRDPNGHNLELLTRP
jgi:catechol 2,3-dioxygenase-like lactoylglutathione lyase family enzyme